MSMKIAVPPMRCASATMCRKTVVLPEPSGPSLENVRRCLRVVLPVPVSCEPKMTQMLHRGSNMREERLWLPVGGGIGNRSMKRRQDMPLRASLRIPTRRRGARGRGLGCGARSVARVWRRSGAASVVGLHRRACGRAPACPPRSCPTRNSPLGPGPLRPACGAGPGWRQDG